MRIAYGRASFELDADSLSMRFFICIRVDRLHHKVQLLQPRCIKIHLNIMSKRWFSQIKLLSSNWLLIPSIQVGWWA